MVILLILTRSDKLKNNEYISKMWIRTLSYIVPIVIIMSFGLLNGSSSDKQSVAFGIGFATVMLIAIILQTKGNIQRYFKFEIPNKLIEYYDKLFKNAEMIQDKDALVCYSKAIVYCYYGEFDKALELMDKINWNDRVPYVQSFKVLIDALICYLRDNNYEEGLRLSITAQKLAETSKNFLGSSIGKDSYNTYIQVGELLIGNDNVDYLNEIEIKFQRTKNFMQKVLVGWCLSIVYTRMNKLDKANKMEDYCKKEVPYCKPFL